MKISDEAKQAAVNEVEEEFLRREHVEGALQQGAFVQSLLDAKDARIAKLQGKFQAAEEQRRVNLATVEAQGRAIALKEVEELKAKAREWLAAMPDDPQWDWLKDEMQSAIDAGKGEK